MAGRRFVADVYAYAGGAGMFLSHVERNRLVHSRNGNTSVPPARGRGSGRGGASGRGTARSAPPVGRASSSGRKDREVAAPPPRASARAKTAQRSQVAAATSSPTIAASRSAAPRAPNRASLQPAPVLPVAVRDDLCLARVWAAGHGAQCSRRRAEGLVFCAQHRARQPRGRVDNLVLLPAEARRFEQHAARVRYDVAAGRWYSRVQMLAEARRLSLSGVEAMTDEQFEDALDRVHEYFRKQGAFLRAGQALQRGAGPTDASQRALPCADYVGRPARFAFSQRRSSRRR